MQWDDEAVILGARPHGESALLVQLFTRERGRHAGLARGARAGRSRGLWEPGNVVTAHWQARLADHLGTLRCEHLRGVAAALIDDPLRLSALAAVTALAEAALPEREPAPASYAALLELLAALAADRGWRELLVRFELGMLAELGFGLDLARCAATGTTEDLVYVSPRSAQAVSRAAGGPWKEKLLPLPAFLRDPAAPATAADIADGLRLTGHFLERHVLAPLGRAMPPAHARFVDRIALAGTKSGAETSPIND